MSFNLFPYKFGKGQWYKADNISENDLAVIVDTNRYKIWFFEGSKSTARDRSNARELLGELMDNYPQYEFKEMSDSAPFEVLEEVEKLKEMSYIKGFLGVRYNLKNFSRLYFYLNYGGAFLLILNMIFLTEFIVTSSTTIYNSYQHYSIFYSTFLFNINFISILILCSFLVFLTSALMALLLKKFKPFIYSFAASIFSFMGFFMLRIWNIILYFDQNNLIIFIRKDVMILLIFDIQLLQVISIVLGFLTGLIGIKLDREIKYLQELKE